MNDPIEVLEKWFGFSSFRDGQLETIESILSGRDTLFVTPTGAGKCVHLDAQVPLSTGEVVSGRELYRRWEAGIPFEVVSHDQCGYQRIVKPLEVILSGVKKGKWIRLRSGRKTWLSLEHRVFTGRGEQTVRDLVEGQLIATPRSFDLNGSQLIPEVELDIIALMLCDGSSRYSQTPNYTKADQDLLDLCSCLTTSLGCTPWYNGRSMQLSATTRPGRRDGKAGASSNPLNLLLKKYGLLGVHSPSRVVPSQLFLTSTDQVCRFLGRVISGGGWIEEHSVAYTSASKALIKQLQHLFLRCGILSRFRYKLAKYQGGVRDSWILSISGHGDLAIFNELIQPWLVGKKFHSFRALWGKLESSESNTNVDVVPYSYWDLLDRDRRLVKLSKTYVFDSSFYLKNSRRMSREMFAKRSGRIEGFECHLLSKNDIFWDEIKYLGPVEEKETFDVVIESQNNGFKASFVADEFVLHNSLTYQIPSLMLPGLTIVISPLISLMKDQVDGLLKLNIPASAYNSTMNDATREATIVNVNEGRIKTLFIAPEGLTATFMRKLDVEVSLLAIDESHCISKWGHDFRPKYLQLANVRKQLGNPTCLAVTATATAVVREDIAEQLEMKNANVLVHGFDRPNLEIDIIKTYGPQKLDALFEFVDNVEGSMIVYCGTRSQVEETADVLCSSGFKAKPYHGGMTAQKRTAVQDAFMNDEAQLIVATNAFGMGVDKSNIRGIAHMQMPGSVEAYYQEIGRAGRDGEPSRVALLYRPGDRSLQDFFVAMSWPPDGVIRAVYEHTIRRLSNIPSGELFVSQGAFAAEIGEWIQDAHIGAVWNFMLKAGVVRKFRANDIGEVAHIEPKKKFRGRAAEVLEYLQEMRVVKHVWFEVSTIDMAKALEMEKKHVSAALRSLNNVAIEYKPPQRSGGVKLIEVKDIDDAMDWVEIDKRRRMAKLLVQQIIDFCETPKCRRKQILDYFGDVSKPADWTCGTCDICRS